MRLRDTAKPLPHGMGCVFIGVLLQAGQARITSGHISSRGMMAENATGILASTPQSLAGLGFPRRQIPCSGIRIPCSGSNSALKFPARLRREFCKKTTQYQCLCGDARGDPNFKHVKTQTRQNKEWLSNRGIGRGYSRFCPARKYLILRLQSRRSIGDLTKGEVGAAAINIGRPRWTADPQSSLECATNGTAETSSELSIPPQI